MHAGYYNCANGETIMVDILPKDIVLSTLIFSLFIIGGVSLIYSATMKDSNFIDAARFATFNKSMNQLGLTDTASMKSDIESTGSGKDDDMVTIMYKKGTSVLSRMLGSLTFFTTILSGSYKVFGYIIPSWLPGIILSIITVIIIFAILSAWFAKAL